MKKGIIAAIFIWMLFLLQSTVFQSLSFNGIVPNLLIVLTASYGFMSGEKLGLIVGFFCGLLCDIFFGDVIGFHALIMMYIGYLNGKFSGGFYPEDIILPMVLNVLSDVSYGFLCYIFMFLLRGRLNFPYYFLHVILPEVVYTTLMTIFLYPLILFVNTRLDRPKKRSKQKLV
ncbi:MAG: rod shape-determining protein MreD [Lachnospiraceae bacterium]|nr:rod shape-determining protein MreD [Lachnospiraceae bacterium]